MREHKTVKIEKKEFLFTQLDPEDALKVLIWLTKSIGGSVSRSLGAFESVQQAIDGKFKMGDLGVLLGALFDQMDEKETIEKLRILLSSVTHDGSDLEVNSPVFYGETLLILKVAKEALEVNFKSFLGGISGVLGKAKAKLLEKSIIEDVA